MSRLQKKCFIASASTHLLLLMVLFLMPAFHEVEKDPDLPVLNFIPTRLTDDPFSGGGDPTTPPDAKPELPTFDPNPPQVEIPTPQPEPPQPITPPEPVAPVEPPPAKPEKPEKQPEKPKKTPLPKPAADGPDAKEKKPERKIKPSFEKATDAKPNARELAQARERAAQAKAAEAKKAYQDRLARLTQNIARNLSSGTRVIMPAGPGGEFYANYAQIVKSVYENAWYPPRELDNESATVTVRVVIARDGNVLSASVIDGSGVRELDQSVERTLRSVKFVAPFLEGAKDKERTFEIDFNLKSKR